MVQQSKFFIHKHLFFKDLFLKKIFSMHVYTKFLIFKIHRVSNKKKLLLVDNYFEDFVFKLKKKKRRLRFFALARRGKYLRADLFIYKHSKLKYSFLHLKFKTNKKKNLYLTFSRLKFFLKSLKLVYVYRRRRGGFLGFSNNIIGYLSRKHLRFFKGSFLIYKRYFILYNLVCSSYLSVRFPSLLLANSGLTRNFNTLKKPLRKPVLKRIKFIFTAPKVGLKGGLGVLLKLKRNSAFIYYYALLRLFNSLKI